MLNVNLENFTLEQNNELACKLGEIQHHLAEDTLLLTDFNEFGLDLSKEIDGYNCVITALYELQKHVDNNV